MDMDGWMDGKMDMDGWMDGFVKHLHQIPLPNAKCFACFAILSKVMTAQVVR